jgi:hypothetical protein
MRNTYPFKGVKCMKNTRDEKNKTTLRDYGRVMIFAFVTIFLLVSLFLTSKENKTEISDNRDEIQKTSWFDDDQVAQADKKTNTHQRRMRYGSVEKNPESILEQDTVPGFHLIHSRITRNVIREGDDNTQSAGFEIINEYWCEVSRERLDEMQKEIGKEIDELLAKGIRHDDFHKYLTKRKEYDHVSVKMSIFSSKEEAEEETARMLDYTGSEEINPFAEGSFTGTEIGDRCWRVDPGKLSSEAGKLARDKSNLYFHKNNVVVEVEVRSEDRLDPKFIENIARKIAEKY